MFEVAKWLRDKGYRFSDAVLNKVSSVLFDRWCKCPAKVSLHEYLAGVEYATFSSL